MDDTDRQTLKIIKMYCEDALAIVDRFGRQIETFRTDKVYAYAVTEVLEQIGEQTGRLSEAFRKEYHNAAPWAHIRGMRNVIAHNYLGLNTAVLWQTVTRDIPALLTACDRLLSEPDIA